MCHEEYYHQVQRHFESKMYKELRYKFQGWRCLQQIDMNPAVSFRAYDIIRQVEFSYNVEQRYRRGLFQSRHKLGRLRRQLETFGHELLPFEITANSVKFDVERAIKFLLEKHGLWELVLQNSRVLMAATVDGGELPWSLTQVSAGIKIVDSRAKGPVTGRLLFGNTGYDRVQIKIQLLSFVHLYSEG